MMEGFSVIMPTFNQAAFIRRAILSLQQQTFTKWELIIINDGCNDDTEEYIEDFIGKDSKIRYIKNKSNRGLGYAINQGLDIARYNYIAYLPSDDYFHNNHLESLKKKFDQLNDAVLVFSGMIYGINDSLAYSPNTQTYGLRKKYCLQLVQTAHKKTIDRWVERDEFVTANLFDMFWRKLADKGVFNPTRKITCNWTSHPEQRHKLISENYDGGINDYRRYFQTKKPLKIKVSEYKFINEEKIYAPFQKPTKKKKNGLKILLVGALSYNPERIVALEEDGHKLYGLWITKERLFGFEGVGPMPFGNVEDIPLKNWQEKVKKIQPDIIYALLNNIVIPIAYEVATNNPGIPFVWQFKEGPFNCLRENTWKQLITLFHKAEGKIYVSEAAKLWYEQFFPQKGLSYVMDGDMPKKVYFTNDFSPLLSDSDGAIHTMIAGRMVGLETNDIKELARNNIHVHLYSDSYHRQREGKFSLLKKIVPDHFHLHPHCKPNEWGEEFSKYDAGWLHCFDSNNNGNILHATWDDLNIPARVGTLAAAGIPMIQKNNLSHIVGMQTRVKEFDMGLFYNSISELASLLKNRELMKQLRMNVIHHRDKFTFDYHVPGLIDFFRKVITNKTDDTKKS